MIRRHAAALLLNVLIAACAEAASPPMGERREVQTPPPAQDELFAVRLDPMVYARTNDRFADLRIVDRADQPIAYMLRKVTTSTERVSVKSFAPERLDAKPLAEGGLELTVKLADKTPPTSEARLVTLLRDFEQRVRLSTSADGQAWEPVAEESVIFDYSRYVDVRNDAVRFPATDRKHFRIVIDDVTVEQQAQLMLLTRRLRGSEETERSEETAIARRPFRIERLEFRATVREPTAAGDETREYPADSFRVDHDAQAGRTILTVDVHRAPITSLAVVTSERNFSRRATVEAPHPKQSGSSWTSIAQGTLTRIDFQNVQRDELTLILPETRAERLRIVIDHRDGPAIQIDGVHVFGPIYEAVYVATPQTQARVGYGDPALSAPTYDTAVIQELLGRGFRPKPVELGPPTGVAAAGDHESDLLNNPYLLGGIIALLVLMLGWGLYHAAKRVDDLNASGTPPTQP